MADAQDAIALLKELANFWPIKAFIVLALLYAGKRIIGQEIIEMIKLIFSEFKDLLKADPTPGGLNAGALCSVLLVGIIILSVLGLSEIGELARAIGAERQQNVLEKSASPYWLLLFIVGAGALSAWYVGRKR